ncbi:MAG: glycosyltransferase [Krumholzibacteria bacterium]|nr:glycosyltransferase [Candidatus Krumholzibacteria bacterium]
MRILHLGKYYHPHRGGMETALRELAEGLAARGVEVSVLVAGGDRDRAEPLTAGGGRLVRAWTPAVLNSQPLNPTLVGLLHRELAAFDPDLVHLHLPNPLGAAAWLVARAGRRRRPPLAIGHHADITRQRLGRLAAGPLQEACLRQALGIAVSSAAHRDGSRELAGHRSRTAVVPFGLDPAPWEGVVARGDGPFLFVGRLVRYKGLDVLLDALRDVPEARLAVVGGGPLAGRLARRAEGLGVADRVEWVGEVDHDELVRRLAAARALILPSLDASETFGLSQLEAMAAGVPVIASDLPTGVREVAAPGASHLLVPPGRPGDLAAAMRRLLADPKLALAMGAAGRARQRRDFTRDAMIDRLLAWYGALLGAERT